MLRAERFKASSHNAQKEKNSNTKQQNHPEINFTRRFSGLVSLSCPNKRLPARFVNQMLASYAKVPADRLLMRGRVDVKACRARQVAIYLLHTSLSLSYAEISHVYRRDRTTIAHSCKVIEDLRDEPAFDEWISGMEEAIGILLTLVRSVSHNMEAANAEI